MRDLLKKHLLKQLNSGQNSVKYPEDLTGDEILYSLLGSIDKNINTIKNLLIGVVAVSGIALFFAVAMMLN